MSATAAERVPIFNRRTGLYEPPLGTLRSALERGDRTEVTRVAERIGTSRLVAALVGADRAEVLLALDGAAALSPPSNVRLLDAVSPLAASSDGEVAERSARTLGRILDSGEPRKVDDWEIPPDALKRACLSLRALAANDGAPTPARLAAIEAMAEAATVCGAESGVDKLGPLLLDPAPEIRRAAALVLRIPRDAALVASLRERLGDSDPHVASAAGVAWCRARLASDNKRTLTGPLSPLGDDGGRLRDLVSAESTPVEDAAEMLPCLLASQTHADRRVLEQLRRGRASSLRARAAELLDQAPGSQ